MNMSQAIWGPLSAIHLVVRIFSYVDSPPPSQELTHAKARLPWRGAGRGRGGT